MREVFGEERLSLFALHFEELALLFDVVFEVVVVAVVVVFVDVVAVADEPDLLLDVLEQGAVAVEGTRVVELGVGLGGGGVRTGVGGSDFAGWFGFGAGGGVVGFAFDEGEFHLAEVAAEVAGLRASGLGFPVVRHLLSCTIFFITPEFHYRICPTISH